VIEQTIRQKLPEGFQTAEFQLQHGMIDAIVPRRELRSYLSTLLELYGGQRPEKPAAPLSDELAPALVERRQREQDDDGARV
jgi:acetyl-CoA carboxylase beta subunit